MAKIAIRENETYRLRGPLSLKVLEGKILIAGFTAGLNFKTILKSGKTIAFKSLSEGLVEINVGTDGYIKSVPANEEVIDEWLAASKEILSKKKGETLRVVILGGTDSGKTSFTTFLANNALAQGFRVAVLDADIGQADIGPPSCISLSMLREHVVSLRECSPDIMYFVGFDTPSYAPEKVVSGVLKILREGENLSPYITIINTDGWIEGIRAYIYKRALIEAIEPNIIAFMGKISANTAMANYLYDYDVIEVPSPKVYAKKSPPKRKAFRESNYMRFLQDSSMITLNADEIKILNTYLFHGDPLPAVDKEIIEEVLNTRVIHHEKYKDELLIIVADNIKVNKTSITLIKMALQHIGNVKIVKAGDEKNILVGILNEKGFCEGIGIIDKIDYTKRKIRILTSCRKHRIKAIVLGLIKINRDGREIEKSPYRFL
ncbi:MAG TPA: hypothetical protein ENF53_00085 [Thermoprotei archaeon]|nr:hypothetical protein [Thermoprotei archaeon]